MWVVGTRRGEGPFRRLPVSPVFCTELEAATWAQKMFSEHRPRFERDDEVLVCQPVVEGFAHSAARRSVA